MFGCVCACNQPLSRLALGTPTSFSGWLVAMASWPTDLAVCHANQNGHVKNASTFEFVSGAIAALSFTIIYILAPLSLIGVPILICVYPYWWLTWMLAAPLILSALLPPVPSRSFLQSWPFKHMPKYFNFTEIKELGDAEVQQLISNRATIFCVQPHGVFSFGGASAGVTWAKNWWHPATIPTAVASSVSATPLVKHLVGLFGTCDAATKPMTKRLSAGKSCVLYIGGIAELFLASGSSETLYVKKRKGFIKLALRSGAEVVPVYFLGNTSVLSVVSNRMLRGFARRTGVTLTWFWGWRGTLLPRPNKILGVLGKPLGLPSTPIPEPTAEEIDHWHGRYMEEVRRIFDTYKKFNPDYAEKQLEFE